MMRITIVCISEHFSLRCLLVFGRCISSLRGVYTFLITCPYILVLQEVGRRAPVNLLTQFSLRDVAKYFRLRWMLVCLSLVAASVRLHTYTLLIINCPYSLLLQEVGKWATVNWLTYCLYFVCLQSTILSRHDARCRHDVIENFEL